MIYITQNQNGIQNSFTLVLFKNTWNVEDWNNRTRFKNVSPHFFFAKNAFGFANAVFQENGVFQFLYAIKRKRIVATCIFNFLVEEFKENLIKFDILP